MKRLVILAVVLGAAAIVPATASASSGWHSCAAQTRSIDKFEYVARASGLQASGNMNCASARYAFNYVAGRAKHRGYWYGGWTTNDGYVTWHKSARMLSGPSDGCGTWRSNVTYREYSSGTAFRFRLYESGC